MGSRSAMEELIELLRKDARATAADLAEQLGMEASAVAEQMAALEKDRAIMGYTAVVDPEKVGNGRMVSAVIEVKVLPERGGGFDRLAGRIARFDQVESCTLMSGAYDLLVVVTGESLHDVARFVADKLSTLEGVTSTSTHFHLKTYKREGFLAQSEGGSDRLAVAP